MFVLVFHVGCYPQRSGNHLFTFKSKTCSSFFLIMTILHVCCLCDESNSSQFLPNFEPSVLKWEMGWVAAASYPDFQPIPLHLASACPSYPLPRFPHLVSIRFFSTSVSLFLPCKPVHLYHFSRFHIYALVYGVCFVTSLIHVSFGSVLFNLQIFGEFFSYLSVPGLIF